jgi:LysM repeat protein
MATRGEQKVDEKKLQSAVENWLKKHRAAVQDKKLQSVVDDFVKSHRKEVSDRGMKIIRRVIAEGRTKPVAKPLTAAKSSPTMQQAEKAGEGLRTKTNTRGPQKPAPKGVSSAVKEATDKAGSTLKKASRVGKLAKGVTGVGALLTAEELGGGKDTMKGRENRRNEFVDKYKRGRGDGASEVAARKAEAKRKADADKPKSYKIKKGDTLSEIAKAKGTTVKALAEKNNIKNPDKIYAGRTLKLNKGGYANCGASMKPTQKSSKGMK